MLLPLYSAPVRQHLENSVRFWPPEYGNDMDILEQVQHRAMKTIKSLKHLSCKERLMELDNVKKRRRDMINS